MKENGKQTARYPLLLSTILKQFTTIKKMPHRLFWNQEKWWANGKPQASFLSGNSLPLVSSPPFNEFEAIYYHKKRPILSGKLFNEGKVKIEVNQSQELLSLLSK